MAVPIEAVRSVLVHIAVLLAALAAEPVLAHHSALHFAASAAELLEQVYLPGRKASLQIEMLAATRCG